jgi:hypothetical protein
MSGMQGVRLNCMGDTDVSDRPLYEAAPASENFFEQTSPLNIPVSRVIGIPLLAHGYREMLPWKGRKLAGDELLTYATNPHFSVLNPRQWRYITGSVLIAREDRKALHLAHIDALMEFCLLLGEIRDINFSESDSSSQQDAQYEACNQKLLNRASKEGFERFFKLFMDRVSREKYGEVASPYEM